MKNLKIATLLLFCIALLSAKCKKENIPVSELSKLPPETHTGANTFGCLVNGQAFLPKTPLLGGPSKQCSYIYTNGGYYFVASGFTSSSTADPGIGIQVQTENLPISADATIPLLKYFTPGMASGSYNLYYNTYNDFYNTNDTVKGELHITYLDEVKQIVSGTFYFDAINKKGEKVEVRNGRFDMYFTR
jgi:hypothetical protein